MIFFLVAPVWIGNPYTELKQSLCNLDFVRIILVQMTGAQGSRIQDDTRLASISNEDQYQQQRTVTLYEDTTYRLHVQFDCNGQSDRNTCDFSQNVKVWIDFNDNGYDDGESRVLRRIRSNPNLPENTYDLELYIPDIDGRNTRAGLHRMSLTVVPSDEYQRDCGTTDFQESREYTVNIVPKGTYSGKSCLLIDSTVCIIIVHHNSNLSLYNT